MTKPRNESTAKKIEEIMALMRKYGCIYLERGDLKIQMGGVPETQNPIIPQTEHKEEKPVTDEDILHNPYAGL